LRANAFNYLVDNTSVININGTPNAAANLIAGDLISIDGGSSYNRVTSVNANTISVATALTANIVAGTAVLRKWQYADNFGIAPSTSIYASSLGGSGDEMHIIVVDEDGGFSSQVANTVIEKYAFVSKASDARNNDGTTNYYKNLINDTSNYIWWMNHQPGATNWGNTAATRTFTTINVPFSASLSAGSTGNVTTANVLTSYAKFQNSDEIDVSLIVSGPGDSTVATSLISLAESRKDAMVFLSPTRASVINNSPNEKSDIVAYRNGLTSSSYAVIDSGYKYQYDKYNDVYRYVPLNGDIAGTCARTDAERDAWFSPGGLNRGLIRNSIKLAYNPTKADRDELYIRGINPVVTFQGEGTVLFGDKTMLNRPSVFDRINVRRLFIILEKSISRAARFSLFEFNDEFTRSQFVNLVEPFLRTVQGRRGITDFRVVCDTSNNTPDVIDRNEFVGDIYIKPNRSINFIQLNFVAVQSGVSFEEIIGNF
jgi:phage tail sheath protein FI